MVFQTTHHDVWDADLHHAPVLITVQKGTRQIAAVAIATKRGLMFILDRNTGKPIYPVEERRVPTYGFVPTALPAAPHLAWAAGTGLLFAGGPQPHHARAGGLLRRHAEAWQHGAAGRARWASDRRPLSPLRRKRVHSLPLDKRWRRVGGHVVRPWPRICLRPYRGSWRGLPSHS